MRCAVVYGGQPELSKDAGLGKKLFRGLLVLVLRLQQFFSAVLNYINIFRNGIWHHCYCTVVLSLTAEDPLFTIKCS